MVECPACSKEISLTSINKHLDSNCTFTDDAAPKPAASTDSKPVASIFQPTTTTSTPAKKPPQPTPKRSNVIAPIPLKRPHPSSQDSSQTSEPPPPASPPAPKKLKSSGASNLMSAMPLAERMRPQTLDDIHGQDLVGPSGVLRSLIEENRVPSMILWGAAGCGKTTIARVIAATTKSRFVEISATASGVAECKKIFQEAKGELVLTGRKTILFCDEIHRFSRSQQDIFLAPVESGVVTLIGATTENPSFKVQSALLSRCRTFTLSKLTPDAIHTILTRALAAATPDPPPLIDPPLLTFLSTFSSGDARTALNLLSLTLSLATLPTTTAASLKAALTKTLVYDRAGDAHYDTISAFHKSIRGSSPDAALFWLARMLAAGEDPLYIARRMVVIASEDVGMADNSLLGLATATFTAVQVIGLPEARINLAHCAVALAEARKSVRVYRGLSKAMEAVERDVGGAAGALVPLHLRNAPTGLMKELGYGREYKYNPDYVEGRVKQEYLPEEVRGAAFLEDRDLGVKVDPDLEEEVDYFGED